MLFNHVGDDYRNPRYEFDLGTTGFFPFVYLLTSV